MITFGYLSFTFVHVVYVSRTVNMLVSPLPVKRGGGALAFVARSSIKYLKQFQFVFPVLYWRAPNYRKEFAKKNAEKNTRRFKVNSSSIRQYTFCLEIQSINRGNPVFFDPSLLCNFRSHRTILSEAVFL